MSKYTKKLLKFAAVLLASAPLFAADLSVEGETVVADAPEGYGNITIGQTNTDPDAVSELIINEDYSSNCVSIEMANSADSAGLAKLIVNGSMGNFGIGGSLMVKNPENANTANAYIELARMPLSPRGVFFT